MIKVEIFETEQGGEIISVRGGNRFYRMFPLYSGDAVVEFSERGISIFKDYEDDESFLSLDEWKEQYDESMEEELKQFIYYVEDGHTFDNPHEELVDDKVFKEMMQTLMLYQAFSQSANQYHWMKLLLKRTNKLQPVEEENNRGNFYSMITLYLPEWEEVYTGGGITEMIRDIKGKNGEPILIVLTENGVGIALDEENNKPIKKEQYGGYTDSFIEPLIYIEEDKENGVWIHDFFDMKEVTEIISADKVYQRICESK